MNWWEKPESLRFASLDQVRNKYNYPKLFLNSMHSGKITFLSLKGLKKSVNKNHTLDSYVL